MTAGLMPRDHGGSMGRAGPGEKSQVVVGGTDAVKVVQLVFPEVLGACVG